MQLSFSQAALQLHPKDNIAIAKRDIEPGTILTLPSGESLTIQDTVPVGHKFALRAIAPGETVLRYGYSIGIATAPIAQGNWVHKHNLSVGTIDKAYTYTVVEKPALQTARQAFTGYLRTDGRAGTRNYIAVIATANCASHVTLDIARAFTPERLSAFPNVDGVIPIVHHAGCCSAPGDLSYRYLQRTLANVARNPNIGGYLYVSLGCEGNQIDNYCSAAMTNLNISSPKPYPIAGTGIVVQDQGGFRKTVDVGIQAIERMLPQVNACARTLLPISALCIGLQCGGSDGWSGVTANPLVGLVVDRIVQQGGTAVLSETPESFGAEHLLTQRVVNAEVARKLIARFEWWNEQSQLLGFSVDNNRSPGNEKGGLTTIFEKSLGAVAKGGSTPLTAAYEYAELVTTRGLVFMDTPGYDPVSATGQLAGGCNLIIFTTGRGSLFASNVAPCVKVASNSALYARLNDDMDFDAGQVLEGVPMSETADHLLELVIAVASGKRTKAEEKGLPETEFVPWQPSPTL